jgi:Domain of unknown function (DUF6378)/Domain of unknown function (DUF4406)
MNVYISGPMTGYPDHNFTAFEEAEIRVLENVESTDDEPVNVFSPHSFDMNEDGSVDHAALAEKPWADFLRRDLNILTSMKFHRIYVLPGWLDSKGARLEVHVASQLGASIWDIETLKRWEPPSETILQEAQRLTSTDRQGDYGHPYDDFNRTAAIINALLGDKLRNQLTGADIPMIMVAVKLSREAHKHKRDNLTDACGYLRTLMLWYERHEEVKNTLKSMQLAS